MHFADPQPLDKDVQLRIWLGGMAFDFRTTRTAALTFFTEWGRRRREAIELVTETPSDTSLLPRLPCERLFHDPAS
ncbi:hypothetical protein [Nocardia cerradoensis]|uniref:Uncharacterized protein n=2 Tax=Nocardia TaxID=1817 RepID=A0A231GWU1_9NOCA|nr:hypothetical protein [Nocardia cerradoensis]NKY45800.1 hypothetical protein [Nocardia cerradoensis]OXR41090.1 hypothetical protein B7C42_06860 [Nocardia cerradoensis]